MFEKVNPSHPDKVADRIAGAIVDLSYAATDGGIEKGSPKIAVEVLLGHGECKVIIETSLGRSELRVADVEAVIKRLTDGKVTPNITIVGQDVHLAENQQGAVRCGDNGIFRGKPVTDQQKELTTFVEYLYCFIPSDGKFILDGDGLIVCQSNATRQALKDAVADFYKEMDVPEAYINPLGDWTGGTDVDSGATNRKLGSDMGDAVTGGGLHGKDLSKADVSVNIVCHHLAQIAQESVEACCAIGDEWITFRFADGNKVTHKYADVVNQARKYILDECDGSFERLAEWGLIR